MQVEPVARVRFRWDDLALFLAVARTRALADAAAALGVDTATVSRRLAGLERALGAALVRRGVGAPRLTPAGAAVLARAEEVERAVRAVARWSADDAPPGGPLRVTAPEELVDLVLVPALPRFRARHPGIKLELVGAAANLDLAGGAADVALRMARPRGAALVARAVARIPYAAYCTDGYRRYHRGPHAYLALDGALARTPEAGWTARALAGRAPELRATSLTALAEAAAAGLGVAILPTPLAARHGALRRLTPAAPPIGERTLYAVVPAALRRDPRVRATLAWFDDALAPLRASIDR